MTFDEVLAQMVELLQREGRVTYRALKRRFALDDDYLEDLKGEIIRPSGWRWMKMARCWSGSALRQFQVPSFRFQVPNSQPLVLRL